MPQFILSNWERGIEKNIYRPVAISGNTVVLGITDTRHFDPFLNSGLITTLPKQMALVGGGASNFDDSRICDFIAMSAGGVYGVGRVSAIDEKQRVFLVEAGVWKTKATATTSTLDFRSMLMENRGIMYFSSLTNGISRFTPPTTLAENWDTLIADLMMFSDAKNDLYMVATTTGNIYRWDGTTKPSVTGALVSLGSGYTITSIGEMNQWIMFTAVNQYGQSFIYSWDKNTVNKFDSRIPLMPKFYAECGMVLNGVYYIFGSSSNKHFIFKWAGGSPQLFAEIQGGATLQPSSNYRSISSDGQNIYIAYGIATSVAGAFRIIKISETGWCYDRYAFDNTEYGIGTSPTGMFGCRMVGGILYVAYGDSSYVLQVSTSNGGTYINTAYLETTMLGMESPHRRKEFKCISAVFNSLPSNTTLTLKYKKDQAGSWITAGTYTTATGIYVKWDIPLEFRTLQFRLEVSGAAITAFKLISLSGEFDYTDRIH